MLLAQAQRLLTDPRYLRELLAHAIAEVTRRTWDEAEVTPQTLLRRQGIVQGLRIADNFIAEALKATGDARAEAEAEAHARRDGATVMPPALAAALVEVRPSHAGEGVGPPPHTDDGAPD